MTDVDDVASRLAAARRDVASAAAAFGRSADEVRLLAVSKTHPIEAIVAAYEAGQRDFGENRVQELGAKARALAHLPGLSWHMIGSVQTNKVRELVAIPGLALLHSLDRARLADELQREAQRAGRSLDVLLQLHATDEASKHGCPPAAAAALLDHVLSRCPDLAVQGVMAMGPVEGDPRPVFAAVVAKVVELRASHGLPLPILSLGMSGDLGEAIAAGSTMVRLGTAVFGSRG
jgi:hypothetical protein